MFDLYSVLERCDSHIKCMYTFKLCDLQTMHLFFSLSKINGVHAHGKRELNIGTPHCFVDDVYAYMYSVYSVYNTHTFHPFIHSHTHSWRFIRTPAHVPNRKHSICDSERNMLGVYCKCMHCTASSCFRHATCTLSLTILRASQCECET